MPARTVLYSTVIRPDMFMALTEKIYEIYYSVKDFVYSLFAIMSI